MVWRKQQVEQEVDSQNTSRGDEGLALSELWGEVWPKSRVVALLGPCGSGKTEIALALAEERRGLVKAQNAKIEVVLADLDVLKPYFRSREARELLKAQEIRLLAPVGELADSDLPLLPADIRQVIRNQNITTIIDVGGDAVGARALGSVADVFKQASGTAFLVLNRHRPFLDTSEKVIQLVREIEVSTQIPFTGLISNTNMAGETTLDDVSFGLDFAYAVAKELAVPVVRVGVPEFLAPQAKTQDFGVLPLWLKRRMQPGFMGGVVLSGVKSPKMAGTFTRRKT